MSCSHIIFGLQKRFSFFIIYLRYFCKTIFDHPVRIYIYIYTCIYNIYILWLIRPTAAYYLYYTYTYTLHSIHILRSDLFRRSWSSRGPSPFYRNSWLTRENRENSQTPKYKDTFTHAYGVPNGCFLRNIIYIYIYKLINL